VLFGASLGLATGQFDDLRQSDDNRNEVRVATYEPQLVFQSSPHAARLNERVGQMQREAQEAQEQGDHQRAMQIQGQMQAVQNEVVQGFFSDVEEAIPDVAAESGVKIVALEVVWVDPDFDEPKDLTTELIEELNSNSEREEAPRSPFTPRSIPRAVHQVWRIRG
jgi:Skp family chaperone for outer membrane proteins